MATRGLPRFPVRTVHTPRQVFPTTETNHSEGVLAPCTHRAKYLTNFPSTWSTGRGAVDGTWWALTRYHSPWLTLNGCCYLLVGLGWSLLFPDGLWIVAVISSWVLDGYCYFLMGHGW